MSSSVSTVSVSGSLRLARAPSSRRARAAPSAAAPSPCSRRSPIPGSRRSARRPGPRAGARTAAGRARTACITSDRARGCTVRPHRSGQDRASRSRSPALLRERGEDPIAVLGRRPSGLPRPRDAHGRGDRARAGASSSTACSPSSTRARPSRPASSPSAPTPRSTPRSRAGRRPIVVGGTGLYLQAALTDLELRPPPGPGDPRGASRPGSTRPAPRRSTPSWPRGRPRPPRRSTRTTAPASGARSSCSRWGRTRPRAAPTRACGPPSCATRRCSAASRWSAPALYARIDAPRRRDDRRRRRRRGRARRRRRGGPNGARGARLRGAARAATTRR